MQYLFRIIALLTALAAMFLVPATFINLGMTETFLARTLNMPVTSSYTGGDIMVSFFDPYDDDRGEGNYGYPKNDSWQKKGILDLIRYTVHVPVTHARWTELRDYWQLDCTFANLDNSLNGIAGFCYPVIRIYIDVDGKDSGSTETAESRSELVSFDETYPWDFVLQADGFSGSAELSNADKSYTSRVPVQINYPDSTISFRLPLDKNGLMNILKIDETRHYVLVGAYDQLAKGHFMPVTAKGGNSTGSGAGGILSPRVFDYLAPQDFSQEEMLGSWNAEEYTYAKIRPVIVSIEAGKNRITDAELAMLKKASDDAEPVQAEKPGLDDIMTANDTIEKQLKACFENGYFDEALSLAEQKPATDNAIFLAFYGSLVAMQGGKTDSIPESVALVNEAYDIFDRCEKLVKTDEERLYLFMNRGAVSKSIPEVVFGKSKQGAEDYMQAAAIWKFMGEARQTAEAYFQAGECFENAGSEGRAFLAYHQALSHCTDDPQLIYQLALKGVYHKQK